MIGYMFLFGGVWLAWMLGVKVGELVGRAERSDELSLAADPQHAIVSRNDVYVLFSIPAVVPGLLFGIRDVYPTQTSVGERTVIWSESRMQEICPSGSMSGK